MAVINAHGPCATCLKQGPLPVHGHENRRSYCSQECRACGGYAGGGDLPHCSVTGCAGPADFTIADTHRCSRCAPDGCHRCFWGLDCDRHPGEVTARGPRPRLVAMAGGRR